MRIACFMTAFGTLAIATPAIAGTEGPYLGVGATHDNVATSGDLEGLGINGLGATIFGGYNIAVGENVFVGLEGNFDITSADAGDADIGFRVKNSFGASARLGYNVNSSTSLYGRVGYQRGRATERFDGESFSSSLDGVRFGAGVQTDLGSDLALRFEYNHTRYSLNLDRDVTEFLGINSAGITNNQAVVGLVYAF